jgi:hypothetical protein
MYTEISKPVEPKPTAEGNPNVVEFRYVLIKHGLRSARKTALLSVPAT